VSVNSYSSDFNGYVPAPDLFSGGDEATCYIIYSKKPNGLGHLLDEYIPRTSVQIFFCRAYLNNGMRVYTDGLDFEKHKESIISGACNFSYGSYSYRPFLNAAGGSSAVLMRLAALKSQEVFASDGMSAYLTGQYYSADNTHKSGYNLLWTDAHVSWYGDPSHIMHTTAQSLYYNLKNRMGLTEY
jgi:hypothetical protein